MPLQASRGLHVGEDGAQVLVDPVERLNTIVYVDFSEDIV
jgi:hypothetical protein